MHSSGIAQDRIDVSTRISYEYGVPLAIERQPGVANRFGFDGLGRSQNHTFSFQGEVAIPGMFFDRYRALLRAGMAIASGSFVSDDYEATNAVHRISRSPVLPSTNRFTIRTSEAMMRLELLAEIGTGSNTRVAAGGWIGFRTSSSVIQTEELVGLEDAIFPTEQSTTRLISAGEELRSNPFRGGAVIALGTRIPLFSRIVIEPEVFTRVDVESLWRGLSVRSLSGGIGLGFSLGPEAAPQAPPVVVDSATLIAPPVTTSLAVELYNAEAAAAGRKLAPLYVARTHHRTWLSISPLLLFDRGSDTLPRRYLHPADADSGTTEGTAAAPTIFEILAGRLREMPGGTITLAGRTAGGESASLATRRMEQVRRHLVEHHGIDPARIRLVTTGKGVGSGGWYGQGVEIIPSDARLLAPFYRQRITRTYSGPRLGITRSIESSGGIRSWRITIRQGSELIAHYSSGSEPPEQIEATFRIDSVAADSSVTPLVAELEVIDRNGVTSVVRDELPLRLAGSMEDRDLRSWLFLDPSIGGTTSAVNNLLLSSIASAARDGVRITIAGSERSGEWGAADLAEKILATLNKAGIEPAEIHITTDRSAVRFPDALPDDEVHATAVGVTMRQRGVR